MTADLAREMRNWIIERRKMIGVDLVLVADGIELLMQAELHRMRAHKIEIDTLGKSRAGPCMQAVLAALPRKRGTFHVTEMVQKFLYVFTKQQITDSIKYLLKRKKLRRVSRGKYQVIA